MHDTELEMGKNTQHRLVFVFWQENVFLIDIKNDSDPHWSDSLKTNPKASFFFF